MAFQIRVRELKSSPALLKYRAEVYSKPKVVAVKLHERNCLCCKKSFMPEWGTNFICKRCKGAH